CWSANTASHAELRACADIRTAAAWCRPCRDCYCAALGSDIVLRGNGKRYRTESTGPTRQVKCPLWVKSGHQAMPLSMSALPPKADIGEEASACLLLGVKRTQSGSGTHRRGH